MHTKEQLQVGVRNATFHQANAGENTRFCITAAYRRAPPLAAESDRRRRRRSDRQIRKPQSEYWLDVCVGMGMEREFVKTPSRSTASSSPSTASPMPLQKPHGSWVRVSEATIPPRRWRATWMFSRKHYQWVPDDAPERFTSSTPKSIRNMACAAGNSKKYADTKELQEACITAQLMKKQHALGDGRLH